ncbi:hypothetical protein VNO80_30705 [Phaseolus coccineus]|uniref:Uncharacterized protein n=1 Tax=Phaseolus coccineus TaxID=3886 RepID=A0AAN9LGT3_PHACN
MRTSPGREVCGHRQGARYADIARARGDIFVEKVSYTSKGGHVVGSDQRGIGNYGDRGCRAGRRERGLNLGRPKGCVGRGLQLILHHPQLSIYWVSEKGGQLDPMGSLRSGKDRSLITCHLSCAEIEWGLPVAEPSGLLGPRAEKARGLRMPELPSPVFFSVTVLIAFHTLGKHLTNSFATQQILAQDDKLVEGGPSGRPGYPAGKSLTTPVGPKTVEEPKATHTQEVEGFICSFQKITVEEPKGITFKS